LSILIFSPSLWSQKEKKLLKKFKTIDEVREYNKENDDYELSTFTANSGIPNNADTDKILALNNGIFQFKGVWMKELKRCNYTGSNARYI